MIAYSEPPESPRYKVTTIGAICDEYGGDVQTGPFGSQLHASDYSEVGIPVVMPQDMLDGRIVCDRIARVGAVHVRNLSKHVLCEGDLVFSRRGDVARFAVVTQDETGWLCGTGSIRIRMNCPKIFIGYAKRYLQQKAVGAWLLHESKGITMPNLNTKIIRELPFIFPPIPEQRRIAAILDQADALRAKRREALAQLDSLTQSIFTEMFGDPRGNERQWPTAVIGSIVSEMRGGAPLEPDDFTDSGFPILHKGAIKPLGRIQVDAKKKTFASNEYAASKPNCIADRRCVAVTLRDLVPTGPSIGLAADLQHGVYDQYLLAQGAYAFHLDPNTVTPEYFVHLSNMPTFRYVLLQNSVGSTQIHIRTPIYLAIKVPLPPIKLQREFSKLVRVIDGMKSRHSSSLSELDALFDTLQHRAFRGEL